MRSFRSVSQSVVAAAALAGLALAASPATAAPAFDTFGSLPAFDAGSGIPTDAFAISQATFGTTSITAALSATERFTAPPVGNDGAGTFSAGASGPADGGLALWNFDFLFGFGGSDATSITDGLADYSVVLRYDVDPGVTTDFGVIDFNLLAQAVGGVNALDDDGGADGEWEDSQNLAFGFLTDGASVPVILPPAGAFDPTVGGIYSFELQITSFANSADTVLASIDVEVAGAIPAPGAIGFLLIGLGGIALRQRRARRTRAT